jgi:hypothetical protein
LVNYFGLGLELFILAPVDEALRNIDLAFVATFVATFVAVFCDSIVFLSVAPSILLLLLPTTHATNTKNAKNKIQANLIIS